MKVSLVQVEKPKRGKRGKKEELIMDPKGDDEITSTITPPGDKKEKLNITDHVKQYAPGGPEMTFQPTIDKAAEMRMGLEKAIEKDAYQELSATVEASQNPIPPSLQAPYINGTYDEAVLESALNRIIQKNKMFEKEKYLELKKKSLEKIAQLLGVQSSFVDSDVSKGFVETAPSQAEAGGTVGANPMGGYGGQGPMAGASTVIGDGIEESFRPPAESESTAVGGSAPIPTVPTPPKAPTANPSKKSTPTEEYAYVPGYRSLAHRVFGIGGFGL